MDHWFGVMESLADQKYADQMAHLQATCGFSRTHANAVVMYARGSTSAKRFATLDDYLAGTDAVGQATVRAILNAVRTAYPGLDLVIAWNQPMLKSGSAYIFGVCLLTKHILMAPWNTTVLEAFAPRLEPYTVNKKTIRVPLDWDVDEALVQDLVGACLDNRAG